MAANAARVTIPAPAIERATIIVESVPSCPLICHKFSEKAQREILEKQMKGGSVKKKTTSPKDPESLFHDAYYKYPGGGYGVPSIWFKLAAVRAGTTLGIPMTESRQAFFVLGERGDDAVDLVKLDGTPQLRIDPVRLNGKTADMRVRAEFPSWSAALTIEFLTHAISLQELVNLVNLSGFCNGVGEWRPQKNGDCGRFRVREG